MSLPGPVQAMYIVPMHIAGHAHRSHAHRSHAHRAPAHRAPAWHYVPCTTTATQSTVHHYALQPTTQVVFLWQYAYI